MLCKYIENELKKLGNRNPVRTKYLEEVLDVYRTRTSPKKVLLNSLQDAEAELISLMQTNLIMEQFIDSITEVEDYSKNVYKDNKMLVSEEIFDKEQKIQVLRWGIAVRNLNDDTDGTFCEVELGKEK